MNLPLEILSAMRWKTSKLSKETPLMLASKKDTVFDHIVLGFTANYTY